MSKPTQDCRDIRQRKAGSSSCRFKMLTRKQLSEQWRCSEKTIDRIIASGELRAHRIGRSVRVAEEDAEVYLALHRAR